MSGSEAKRIRQLESIAHLGMRALVLETRPLLDEVVEACCDALDVDLAKVLELESDGESLLLRAGKGWDDGLVGVGRVPTGVDSQAGYTLASAGPVVVEDLLAETRFQGAALLIDHAVRSGISVTVPGPGGAWGVLGVHSRRVAQFSVYDVAFVQSIANLIAAKLRESDARIAQQEAEARVRVWQRMEAIGTLAGGIAHDFNNLLTAILSYTELAQSSVAEQSQAYSDLAEIRSAALSAGDLTSQILAFGRKQMLLPKHADVNLIVQSALRLLRRVLGEHVEIDFVPGAELGQVFVDATQIEQVIVNLCVNARDAMPDGGRITIETANALVNGEYTRLHPWATPGRYVLLSISDTGDGMTQEVLERVFEPFFTTKELGRGTGLGLATVHGIVHQHGGMVHVYSEVGEGTVFKVYLPISNQMATKISSKPAPKGPRGSGRILVAEDEPFVRSALARVLEKAGYQVEVAEDGQVALNLFRERPDEFALVLLDVVMPNLGGRQALAQMRAIRPELRFLLASGYAGSESLDQTERAAWVTKPFDPDQLLLRIRRALDDA